MLLFVISVACFAAPRLRAQLESTDRDTGWVGLELALRRLQTTVSVLFVTAHPDDENNALLAYLSQGRGCRVGILTLTRGAGGQNEIGPELGDALAILRTEELIAVHRHDKVEQRFGRVVDFGYSFSVDETLEKWGAEETLEDIVRVVRDFRPDVMITMRPDGAGGGQHHQTSARLAEEAFEISGDVRRFPHHVDEGLRPWKPRQLYRAPFRLRETETPDALAVPVGEFDLALGKSFAEFGAAVRNLHRSQGMNAPPTLLSTPVWLLPVVPAKVPVALAGLPWGLERLTAAWEAVGDLPPAELLELVETADEVAASFRAGNWGSTTTGVMRGLAAVTALEAKLVARKEPASEDVRSLLTEERKDWLAAAEVSHQFACVARVRVADADQPPGQASGPTADGLVTAGETFVVETTVVKRAPGRAAVRRVKVSVPTGWTVEAIDGQSGELETGRARTWNHRVTVAEGAAETEPFWRRDSPRATRYTTTVSPRSSSLPFLPPPVQVQVEYVADGVAATFSRPVIHRWYDPRSGAHRTRAIQVVPGISLTVEPRQTVVPTGVAVKPRQIRVRLRRLLPSSIGATSARLELRTPPGWHCEPSSVEVRLEGENVEREFRFDLTPPARLSAGDYPMRAVAIADGKEYTRGFQSVAYHHVQTRHLYRRAETILKAFPVAVADGLRVGYVMGVGDAVPTAISDLGADVSLLDDRDLATGDLEAFDTIVTGIRAYKDRGDLQAHNGRLLQYVHGGGVLIAQYNKYEFHRAQYAPYPCTIRRPHDRVTDENSPVRVLQADHPVFRRPNPIGPMDWEGWVQERGLYFLGTWDEAYTPLLELEDSFAYNAGPKRGALVVARYGRGLYVYTGLAFFRQLPAGVPGAYRLFANLISLGTRQ